MNYCTTTWLNLAISHIFITLSATISVVFRQRRLEMSQIVSLVFSTAPTHFMDFFFFFLGECLAFSCRGHYFLQFIFFTSLEAPSLQHWIPNISFKIWTSVFVEVICSGLYHVYSYRCHHFLFVLYIFLNVSN